VETGAQRDFLQGLQCEAFQGFLCSPGLAAQEFEALYATLPMGLTASERGCATRLAV
jgi:hypothetical protein